MASVNSPKCGTSAASYLIKQTSIYKGKKHSDSSGTDSDDN